MTNNSWTEIKLAKKSRIYIKHSFVSTILVAGMGKVFGIESTLENMNTKIVMISSSVLLAILGSILTFLPNEISSSLLLTPNPISSLSFQLLGALYLGFAMLNWMAKGSVIGGIYNKPIALGNFMHFAVGALALVKMISKIQIHSEIVISLTVVYAVFALLFAYIFRTNPSKKN